MTSGEVVKGTLDIASMTTLGAWFIGLAPTIATVFTAVWAVLRVVEQLKNLGWIGEKSPPPPSPFEPLD